MQFNDTPIVPSEWVMGGEGEGVQDSLYIKIVCQGPAKPIQAVLVYFTAPLKWFQAVFFMRLTRVNLIHSHLSKRRQSQDSQFCVFGWFLSGFGESL